MIYNHLIKVFLRALKILQITNRIPFPLNDGGNIAMWYNLHHLRKSGHQTFLASLNTNKHHQNPAVVSDIAEVHSVDINTDVKVLKAFGALFSKTPYNISRFWSKDFSLLISDLCKKEQFDVIQMEGIYLALYIDVIRQATTSPIILRAHNIEHEIWKRLSKDNSNKLKKLMFKFIFNEVNSFEENKANKFDGIVCISKKDENFFEKFAPKIPRTTISAGIDFDKYQISPNSPQENTLCMLGSMEWEPNVEGLFWFLKSVWPMVHKDNSMLELHVAGKNPPQKVLDIVEKKVTIHGMVPDAQEFLKSYEVLIVPLFSGSGMRLKIVEALALGKCIISTSIGAEGIPYTNGEDLLIADTPEEMRGAINQLMSDKALVRKIQRNARQLAETHFDWNQLVKQFENFYSKFL